MGIKELSGAGRQHAVDAVNRGAQRRNRATGPVFAFVLDTHAEAESAQAVEEVNDSLVAAAEIVPSVQAGVMGFSEAAELPVGGEAGGAGAAFITDLRRITAEPN